MTDKITHDELTRQLKYHPDTGEWVWLTESYGHRKFSKAGCLYNTGYRVIYVNGKRYNSSRLAWYYMTGEWPKNTIDHIDRNSSNDKWNNLRVANKQQQQYNHSKLKRKYNLPKWVHKAKNNRFSARIKIENGKQKHLGVFDTIEEAYDAAVKVAKRIHGNFYHE